LQGSNTIDLHQMFIGWIDNGAGADIGVAIDKWLKKNNKNSDFRGLSSSIFAQLEVGRIAELLSALKDYVRISTRQNKEFARDKVLTVAGFLSLTLFSKEYIGSIRSLLGRHVVIDFRVPSDESRNREIFAAVAIGIANQSVPKFKLGGSGGIDLDGIEATGAIVIREMSVGSVNPDERDRAFVKNMVEQLWRAVFDSNPPFVPDEPAQLALPSRRQLVTRIADARETSNCLNLHFYIDPTTYSDVPDWASHVDSVLTELNEGLTGDIEYLPTIIISDTRTGVLPYNKEEGRRALYLRKIVDLTEG